MDTCQHMWCVFSDRRASLSCGREPSSVTIVCYEYQCEIALFTLHLPILYIENSLQLNRLTFNIHVLVLTYSRPLFFPMPFHPFPLIYTFIPCVTVFSFSFHVWFTNTNYSFTENSYWV